MFNFCIDGTYLSVNRVNAIGEYSNISPQLRTEFHCASPIPHYVFLSCDNKDKTAFRNLTTPRRTQSSISKLFSCPENLFQYVDAARRSIKETLQEAIDLRMSTIKIIEDSRDHSVFYIKWPKHTA